MITIIDYWGKEREFEPAEYAKEEYRYPNGDFKFPCGDRSLKMFDLRKLLAQEFNRETLESVHQWWLEENIPEERYMFRRMCHEIELYLGWRIHNGYHQYTATWKDIVDCITKAQEATNVTAAQRQGIARGNLNLLIFRNDQAIMLENFYPSNIYKLVMYTYCVAVKNQPPGIASEAIKDADAQYYLKRYDIETDDTWTKHLDKRIEKERKKKGLE